MGVPIKIHIECMPPNESDSDGEVQLHLPTQAHEVVIEGVEEGFLALAHHNEGLYATRIKLCAEDVLKYIYIINTCLSLVIPYYV